MATEKRADVMTGDLSQLPATISHPPWLQQRLEWFRDLKFGLFIHWGIYSQWGCIESWPLVEADTWARPDELACWRDRGRDLTRFQRDYRALNTTFNPARFEPTAWADAAAGAGMKYVCFTTKHHDGFCMFDTRTTDYRVTHPSCPFHRHPRANVARHVFDAFRRRGLAASCYFSKSDWHCPWYWRRDRHAPDRNPNYDTHAEPAVWERFVQFVHAQVRELMRDYGPMDVLWLDGGHVRPPDQDLRMDEMVAMARRLQPGLIVADRTVGGTHENIVTPEQAIPDTPIDQPWESCLTMGSGWSYRPDDTYKPARRLIHMLVDIVAKGGNFLLNIGPGPDGALAPEALRRLREIGRWMGVNAEAIHGSRAVAPYVDGPVRYTRNGDRMHAIVLAADDDRPAAPLVLHGPAPADGAAIRLLGSDAAVTWTRHKDSTLVRTPHIPPPGGHAWVYAYTTSAG